MSLKKEEKKNLNYFIQQNKDFSFRNDEENNTNESLNLALISNSSSKNQVLNNIELSQNKNRKKGKTEKENKIDLLNQLIVNRLVQENKFIKQELELAKSNILILEEKESQYKSTIEHMNIINEEKEISYKNILSLINSYKQREAELNQKISSYSKELIKKNDIINKLNQKINAMNEQMSHLNNILSEKMQIINMLSRNKKNKFNSFDLNLNDTISKSANIKNHNRKESDAKLLYREKTLNNINFKLYDFNNIDNNYITKKYSNERLNTLNNLNFHGKLILNNNNNTNNIYNTDINNIRDNNANAVSNRITKLVQKKSGYKKIINNKNIDFSKNIINTQSLKKNNSYKNVGYNSINSTINKNKNIINNSPDLFQDKKVDNKIYHHFNINPGKIDLKKIIMISPSYRYKNTNSNNINNNYIKNNSNILNDYNKYNYSSIVDNNDKYHISNIM